MKLTRKVIWIYFFILISAFFGNILIAWLLFPGGYDILENSVSTLGVVGDNPNGWIFFTIALYSVAFGIIPLYLIIFKLLNLYNKPITIIVVILYILTSIGLFMVGTFQEGGDFRKLHLYASYFGFGGFFLAGVFTWIVLGIGINKLDALVKKRVMLMFIIEIFILSAGATGFLANLIMNEAGIINYRGEPISQYIGFPFTEWMLVFAIFIEKIFLIYNLSQFIRLKNIEKVMK
jgi:hypothetical protein